jgi:hypothetical protein
MTKRSSYMLTLITIEAANITGMLVRKRLNQNNCGETTLQVTIVQYVTKYTNMDRSCG